MKVKLLITAGDTLSIKILLFFKLENLYIPHIQIETINVYDLLTLVSHHYLTQDK